jgi:hypothetical protein
MLNLAKAKTLLKEFIGVLRSGIWVLEGNETASGEPLKVFFAGSETQKAHLSGLAFGGTCKEHYYGKLYFWNILYWLRINRHQCDIAILEGSRLHRFLYKKSSDFFMPIWLKTKVAIPLLVTSRSYKEDIRRIRKCQLSYEITREDDKVDNFYHHMYRPAVNASHGKSTIEIGYDNMKKLLDQDKCVLLLVIKEGMSIAGALIILGNLPRLWAIGVRSGDLTYRKCSANTAAYHFGAQYLTEQGYQTMHLGMSRGFLNDGILQYKNKWDQRVTGCDSSGFILKILRVTAGTKSFLINNPFVYLNDEKLYGAVFIGSDNQDSEKDFKHLRKKYFLNGLSGLNVFLPGKSAGDYQKIEEY